MNKTDTTPPVQYTYNLEIFIYAYVVYPTTITILLSCYTRTDSHVQFLRLSILYVICLENSKLKSTTILYSDHDYIKNLNLLLKALN